MSENNGKPGPAIFEERRYVDVTTGRKIVELIPKCAGGTTQYFTIGKFTLKDMVSGQFVQDQKILPVKALTLQMAFKLAPETEQAYADAQNAKIIVPPTGNIVTP